MSGEQTLLDASQIAEVLTEAQRRAVLTNDRGFADHAKGKWFSPTIVIARKLYGFGLIETEEHLARPTPLGLEVRAALKARHAIAHQLRIKGND